MASTNALFQGTLQEAIAHSIQNSVPFAALIVGESSDAVPDCRVWEEQYLGDYELAKVLNERTILYKMVAESQDAMNLYAFVPKPEKLPCLVVIKNGTAQTIGVADGQKTLEEVKAWVVRVVGPQDGIVTRNEDAATTALPVPPLELIIATELTMSPEPMEGESLQNRGLLAQPPGQPPPLPPSQYNVYTPPESDSTTLSIDEEEGKGKAEAHLAQEASKNSNLVTEQRKQMQEARQEEGERAKKLLEADQTLRAAREKEAREARERDNGGVRAAGGIGGPQGRAAGLDSNECALSFRLLDGSALKHKFPAEVKLGEQVRMWIDQNRPDKTDRPYTFTQILTPFPNKPISLSEENSSLKDLGLTPSATLILTPINTIQASAYPSLGAIPSPWRLVRALTTGINSVVDLGYNTLTSAVDAITFSGQPETTATETASSSRQVGSALARASMGNEGARIMTIHDVGSADGRNTRNRYYNGNQLDFEPNPDARDASEERR